MKKQTKLKLIVGLTALQLIAGITAGVHKNILIMEPVPQAEAQIRTLAKFQNYTHFEGKELVQLLKATGFKGEAVKYAWAVVMKESRGNALDYNGNVHTGDNSYGLFQINMIGSLGPIRRAQYGLAYNAQLLNPVENAKIAYKISDGGKNWGAWKGTNQPAVRYWVGKYPYKAHTQATKAKAKAKAKATALPKKVHARLHKVKAKVVAKAKPKQKQ